MTTITTDRAGLEELLGEYWEIAFEESSEVVAIGNKANRVLHEIRALFDVKQAEIARLKAESEERLQNCAALVAENERLRAAPATVPDELERKPMTKGQREQVVRRAEGAMNSNINLSWRDALMYETEAFHGITGGKP